MHSFFYPDHGKKKFTPLNSRSFFTLRCDKLVDRRLSEYFTDDRDILTYRNKLFAELITSAELRNALTEVKAVLKEFIENITYTKKLSATAETSLRSLLTAKEYVDTIRSLCVLLQPYSAISSIGNIYYSLKSESETDDFIILEKESEKFEEKINDIKSITVGINLDAQLRPKEAGLISINSKPFKSGNTIDRFLRLEFKRDEYCVIAPLTALKNEAEHMLDTAINNAMDKVFKNSCSITLKAMISMIEQKMFEYTCLNDELDIILSVIKYIKLAQEKGMPLCIAEIGDQAEINEFYDPLLCREKARIVSNDIVIPKNTDTIILTGQNSGGKTVVLRSLGLIHLFAMLGIPIPAKKAVLKFIPESVGVAFSPDNTVQIKGRLEQECAELGEFIKAFNENGVIFLDEPFSTTSPEDGVQLSEEYTAKLKKKRNTIVFMTTHLHEFANEARKKEGSLCCELDKFKLRFNSVAASSDAKRISDKYW